MIHSEGVGYTVTDEKPWRWSDYWDECPTFTKDELLAMRGDGVDLADWVRTFGARLENNFALHYYWMCGK